MARPRNTIGQVYHCPVCGAEVTVIAATRGELTPHCCNEAMSLLPQLHRAFHCPVCGAEIIVVRQGPGELTPHCCNCPMSVVDVAA